MWINWESKTILLNFIGSKLELEPRIQNLWIEIPNRTSSNIFGGFQPWTQGRFGRFAEDRTVAKSLAADDDHEMQIRVRTDCTQQLGELHATRLQGGIMEGKGSRAMWWMPCDHRLNGHKSKQANKQKSKRWKGSTDKTTWIWMWIRIANVNVNMNVAYLALQAHYWTINKQTNWDKKVNRVACLLWRIRMRVAVATIKAERARERARERESNRESKRERTIKGQLTGLKDKLTKRSQQTKRLHKTVRNFEQTDEWTKRNESKFVDLKENAFFCCFVFVLLCFGDIQHCCLDLQTIFRNAV